MRMQKMLKYLFRSKRQRRMGVEPIRDRAERPPNRFEDGETHRGPYTSMQIRVASAIVACFTARCQAASASSPASWAFLCEI